RGLSTSAGGLEAPRALLAENVPFSASTQGQVSWAMPKTRSCSPPSGFILGDPLPARIVTVPVALGEHCANPLLSTLAASRMFPLQNPVLLPMHQVISSFRGTIFEELP